MLATEREIKILDYLRDHGSATTNYLSEYTGASLATIRRDLNSMDRRGLLHKTHGGAVRKNDSSVADKLNDVHNIDPYYKEKDQIAQTAADLIESGDIIFLGSGKTCTLLAKYIKQKHNITIVTTNVDAVLELHQCPNISMLLLGGDVHVGSNYIETLGEYTFDMLNKLFLDKVFITVNGIDLESGYSILSRLQLPLYNHLLKNSKSFYLLADSSKFDKRTFAQLWDIGAIPNIITNPETPHRYFDYYQKNDIRVYTK